MTRRGRRSELGWHVPAHAEDLMEVQAGRGRQAGVDLRDPVLASWQVGFNRGADGNENR